MMCADIINPIELSLSGLHLFAGGGLLGWYQIPSLDYCPSPPLIMLDFFLLKGLKAVSVKEEHLCGQCGWQNRFSVDPCCCVTEVLKMTLDPCVSFKQKQTLGGCLHLFYLFTFLMTYLFY
ncbi:hypothetical protein ATANTOWER_031226 [Ataeniobius toweri]|uniref:Uncharacterized protein n=1 Tax=Ataeniobius toweri TaxID=208326 RepID=A0ABU7BTU2_9TELE|nr:hypothetical protein [Ataeniobius toweri]